MDEIDYERAAAVERIRRTLDRDAQQRQAEDDLERRARREAEEEATRRAGNDTAFLAYDGPKQTGIRRNDRFTELMLQLNDPGDPASRKLAETYILRRIDEALPSLMDSMIELAMGVFVEIETPTGILRRFERPPNVRALIYLLDRRVGKVPDATHSEIRQMSNDELVEFIQSTFSKKLTAPSTNGQPADPPAPE